MAAVKLNISKNNLDNKPKQMSNNMDDGADIQALYRERLSIDDLLVFITEHKCSDLYITVDDYPYVSRFGKIYRVPSETISKEVWSNFYDKYILNELNGTYVHEKLLDTSVEIRIPDTNKDGTPNPNYEKFASAGNPYYRYRVSFGYSQEKNVATFRTIRPEKITFDDINYNTKCIEALRKAYAKPSGICYFTGPTGSGKSTTMAACINTFTKPNELLDNKVFITLEDPIENLFDSTDSVKISQKELGKDFRTFALGIKAALREHPNQILVGECRDKEVICAAIEAARTGHVTSTTFHASDVAGTLNRLMYHLDNDKNLSLDLILQLNIIMAQKMLKSEGKYLVDTQFMVFDDKVTKRLVDILDTPDANLPKEVNKMFEDPELLELGLVKDWDYKHLH